MNTGNLKSSASAKKFSAKKPKDKPKRPLSSYNFFLKVCSRFLFPPPTPAFLNMLRFRSTYISLSLLISFLQAEREKIVKFVKGEGTDDHEPDQPAADASALRLKGDRICFEQMGKLIGKRWKTLSAESLKRYSDMALADAERYKNEMAEYKARRYMGVLLVAAWSKCMRQHTLIHMDILHRLILHCHILVRKLSTRPQLTIHEVILIWLKVHIVNTHVINSTKTTTASIAEVATACLHLLTVEPNITLLNMHLNISLDQAVCRKDTLCLHIIILTTSIA
jgi:hypothetical protein